MLKTPNLSRGKNNPGLQQPYYPIWSNTVQKTEALFNKLNYLPRKKVSKKISLMRNSPNPSRGKNNPGLRQPFFHILRNTVQKAQALFNKLNYLPRKKVSKKISLMRNSPNLRRK